MVGVRPKDNVHNSSPKIHNAKIRNQRLVTKYSELANIYNVNIHNVKCEYSEPRKRIRVNTHDANIQHTNTREPENSAYRLGGSCL